MANRKVSSPISNAELANLIDQSIAAKDAKKQNEAASAKTEATHTAAQTAAAEAAQEQADTAKNAYMAGINAGLGKSKAGMLSDTTAGNNYGSNLAGTYQSTSSAATQAQTDYEQNQAQLQSMYNQASNLNNASLLTAIGSGISGASSGIGLASMVSDENAKEAPFNDDELLKAINEFKELSSRYKKLKGEEK